MNPVSLLRRAFASPSATKLSEVEAAQYAAANISEPTIQRYIAWRRALIFMVVIATVLSAGLTTYRNLTEEDDDTDLIESFTEPLTEKFANMLPANAAQKAVEIKEKAAGPKQEEKENPEAKAKTGKDDEAEVEGPKMKNAFEKFTEIMEAAPLFVLAAMALIALLMGNNLRLSYKFLMAGFLFGFLLPMAIAVCPWSWFGEKEVSYSMAKDPVNFLKDLAEGLLEGGKYLVILLPTVLSLVPGILKGSMKVKNLLPQSLLPGWFVVMAAPLYGLFLLVIFIAVAQVTAEPLVLAGMGLVVVAHFVYAFRAEAFTAPLLEEADHKRLQSAQLMVTGITAVGGICLLTFLLSQQVMGVHLFGTDPKKALMQPLDLVEYALVFVTRSMFMTALSVDLLMRMNLAAWRHTRTLSNAPSAVGYEQTMNCLEKVVG